MGTVSFWRRVSSEQTYDILRFPIEGEVKDEISGDLDWQKKSYPLTEGSHRLKWEYAEDSDDAAGLDAAWVDQLMLPATLAPSESGDDTLGRILPIPTPGADSDPPLTQDPAVDLTPGVTPGVSAETGLPATEEAQPAAEDSVPGTGVEPVRGQASDVTERHNSLRTGRILS